jgi:hypothetical protein
MIPELSINVLGYPRRKPSFLAFPPMRGLGS